jgi:hypothetical protein
MTRPLCFVLMPFGKKPTVGGTLVDFDGVYREVIAPGIVGAELDPLRADEEMTGGIIHKPMFERLILCEYAVADLTKANANVFYEMGLRHAVRPASTVLVFAQAPAIALRCGGARAAYSLDPESRQPRRTGCAGGEAARGAFDSTDSPVFQLVEGFGHPAPQDRRVPRPGEIWREVKGRSPPSRGRMRCAPWRRPQEDRRRGSRGGIDPSCRTARSGPGEMIALVEDGAALAEPSSCRSSTAWRSTAPGAGTRRSGC